MTAPRKMTIKSLTEELEIVKEQLKEFHHLKLRVVELEKEVKFFKARDVEVITVNEVEMVENSQEFKCLKCDNTFCSQKALKKHVVEYHPRIIECYLCDSTFQKNHEVETHMEEHKVKKSFRCDICQKDFYLLWRLNKHRNVHLESTKPCHYHTSKRKCPFEAVGCKFRHDVPVYDQSDIMEKSEDECMDDTNNDTSKDSEDEELQENQCHLCMKLFQTRDYLMQHYETEHVQFLNVMNSRNQSKS